MNLKSEREIEGKRMRRERKKTAEKERQSTQERHTDERHRGRDIDREGSVWIELQILQQRFECSKNSRFCARNKVKVFRGRKSVGSGKIEKKRELGERGR